MSAVVFKTVVPACSISSYRIQKPEPAEPPSAERREQALAFARQAIEASLALADRMEAA